MTGARFATIAQELRERIALGEFGELGAVESEAELGARYAVSRPTVRRALELLRDEGLVESRQGAGWFVRGGAFHQRLALGTFRHAGSAVAEAGREWTREVVDFGFTSAPAGPAQLLALAVGAPVLHARSVRTVDGEGLDIAQEWVPAALAGRISRDDAARPGIWEALGRDGHRVASVHQTITAAVATDADAALLHTSAGWRCCACAASRRTRTAYRSRSPITAIWPTVSPSRWSSTRGHRRPRPSHPACGPSPTPTPTRPSPTPLTRR